SVPTAGAGGSSMRNVQLFGASLRMSLMVIELTRTEAVETTPLKVMRTLVVLRPTSRTFAVVRRANAGALAKVAGSVLRRTVALTLRLEALAKTVVARSAAPTVHGMVTSP